MPQVRTHVKVFRRN